MKRSFLIFTIIILLSSCSLFVKDSIPGSIYLLDWSQEAIFVIDSLFNASQTPLLNTGTAPSDFIIDGDNIYISNSGFGGQASVQKFSIDGTKEYEYDIDEATSPAGIEVDDNYVYIAQFASSSILILNKEDLSLFKEITVNSPYGLLLYGDTLFIGTTSYSDPTEYIYLMNTSTFSIIDSMNIGPNPSYFARDNDCIYVSCVGNSFSDIKGVIAKIENGSITKINLESYPGKIIYYNNMLFLTNGYIDDSGAYSNNVLRYNANTLKKEYTYSIASASALTKFRDYIIIATNSGPVYTVDLNDLSIIDTLDIDFDLKITEIRIK